MKHVTLLVIALALLSGCARTPEAKLARHLERGDRYFREAKYETAVLEYTNVLRLDRESRLAVYRLGIAHFELGELVQAFRYLRRTQEQEPDNLDARQRLAAIYLAAERFGEAEEEVDYILAKDPNNFGALTLLPGTARTREARRAVIKRLEAAKAAHGHRAKLHSILGALYAAVGDLPAAEQHLKEGIAREPKSTEGYLMLADFYRGRSDLAAAEATLKTAVGLGPVDSPARLRLADFYVGLGRRDDARKILDQITVDAPNFLPGWRRRAEFAFSEGKYDDSAKAVEALLKKNRNDLEGLLLSGRLHLVKRQPAEAIIAFRNALKSEPRFTEARIQLALAHLQAGDAQQAKAELGQAVASDSTSVQARLMLAELNLQSRATEAALADLEKLVAQYPRLTAAHRLLGSAYLSTRQPGKAVETYRKLVAASPKDPQAVNLLGMALGAQGKVDEAAREFERALTLRPDFVPALTALVTIDFTRKRPQAALERVNRQIAKAPKSGPLHHVLGGVYLGLPDMPKAEAAFLKAIALEPRLAEAYLQLASVYAATKRWDEGLAKAEEFIRLNPRGLSGYMLAGIIQQARGDVAGAQKKYEQALEVSPRFVPAANNLAWLLAENGGDKEKALRLAQIAKEGAPDDPNVSDTLGWVLYRRGVYDGAARMLGESAAKRPNDPAVHYRLGMAHYKAGNNDAARTALQVAMKSPVKFSGRQEAERTLAQLR